MNYLAPVIVFCYCRPDTLFLTLDSLRNNPEAVDTVLYLYHDGLRTEANAETIQAHGEVQRCLADIQGFKSVQVIAREQNFGLAKSIISGVTEVLERYGSAIILEDDLVVGIDFLSYMNEALDRYKDCETVASIHAYNYPETTSLRLPEVFFARGADCWGWAVWQRSWAKFESQGEKLLESLSRQGLLVDFNPGKKGPYVQMLKDQIAGKNNSWAIRWHASAYLLNMYTLYPNKSLVNNVGFDSRATHTGNTDIADRYYHSEFGSKPQAWPVEVRENKFYKRLVYLMYNDSLRRRFQRYFKEVYREITRQGLFRFIWQKVCRLVPGLKR